MKTRQISRWFALFGIPLLAGCAVSAEQKAAQFIARMDAAAPEKRVPNWETTRALITRPAPKVGEPAPDFTLTTCAGGGTIQRSQLQGSRPVVLIFGSWT